MTTEDRPRPATTRVAVATLPATSQQVQTQTRNCWRIAKYVYGINHQRIAPADRVRAYLRMWGITDIREGPENQLWVEIDEQPRWTLITSGKYQDLKDPDGVTRLRQDTELWQATVFLR